MVAFPRYRWLSSGSGGTIGSMTMGMDEIAVLVRKALAAEDLSAFAEFLDPAVTWGAPGARNPSCKNRNQVLAWYQRGRDSGVRGSVFDVEVLGDRLLVSMSVRGTENGNERGGAALRYQVLTVRSGKVVDIVGFDDKSEALSYVS
jgi:SnoaL-like domain